MKDIQEQYTVMGQNVNAIEYSFSSPGQTKMKVEFKNHQELLACL